MVTVEYSTLLRNLKYRFEPIDARALLDTIFAPST